MTIYPSIAIGCAGRGTYGAKPRFVASAGTDRADWHRTHHRPVSPRTLARVTLPWQFKGTFRGISVGYEFRIEKAKRRRYLWKRKNCQSSASGISSCANSAAARLAKSSMMTFATAAGSFDTRFTLL